MLNKLLPNRPEGLPKRPEPRPDSAGPMRMTALDLRSQDPSAARDRAAHRRSTWLYEDLLN